MSGVFRSCDTLVIRSILSRSACICFSTLFCIALSIFSSSANAGYSRDFSDISWIRLSMLPSAIVWICSIKRPISRFRRLRYVFQANRIKISVVSPRRMTNSTSPSIPFISPVIMVITIRSSAISATRNGHLLRPASCRSRLVRSL